MSARLRGALPAVLAAAALLLVAGLRSTQQSPVQSEPSTYDTGPAGYAALYELLRRENVAVERYEQPGPFREQRSSLVVAGDLALLESVRNQSGLRSIDDFVRKGGTLVVLGRYFDFERGALNLPKLHWMLTGTQGARTSCGYSGPALDLAGDFGATLAQTCEPRRAVLLRSARSAVALAYRHGNGTVIAIVSPSVFDNAHLGRTSNAQFAYDIFAGRGSVWFDERIHGYQTGTSFWRALPESARIAAWLAAIGLMLALIGANVRHVPAYAAAVKDERDSSDYLASLARMLQRGGAEREVIGRLRAAAHAVLRGRDAASLHDLQEGGAAGAHDVLRAGALYAQVRKEYR